MDMWRTPSTGGGHADAIRRALRALQRKYGLPTVFGGFVGEGSLCITELVGTRTEKIKNLHVAHGSGLGGRVLSEGSPQEVADYVRSSRITHEYDGPVGAEGLRAVAAAPVYVPNGGLSAVLYVGARDSTSWGQRSSEPLLSVARQLSFELAVENEVDRRLREAGLVLPESPRDVADLEGVREVHAELRSLAHVVDDPEHRRRLEHAAIQLAQLGAPREGQGRLLSVREIDVLACVALGYTNKRVAARLGIREETVKSYLRSAMSKLDVKSRLEAVVRARALSLLP